MIEVCARFYCPGPGGLVAPVDTLILTRVYPGVTRGRGPGELPAVDVQDLAGDEGRGFQEQDAVHDVADMAHAAERRKQAAEAMIVAAGVHRGRDDARGDGVDPDATGAILDGQRAGGRGQAALGQGGQHRGRTGVSGFSDDGADVDHVAAVPHRHLANGALRQPEEPGDADSHHGGVIGGGVAGERLGNDHARVIDQGVDAAEAVQCGVDDPVGGGGCGDISVHGDQVRFLRPLDRAGTGHHRPVPLPVPGDQASTDAPRGSGDDGDLAGGHDDDPFHGWRLA